MLPMLPKVFIFFLLALQLELISECTCFNLIVDKRYQQVPSKQMFSVLCLADVPLAACQMRRYYLDIFFDLSRGNDTPVTGAVSYAGSGLETGQCGLSISKQSFAGGYNVYGCRARSSSSGWKHGVAVVDVSDGTYWTLPVESGPGTVLAELGSDVTLSFATGGTLNFCNFKWPGLTSWTRNGTNSTYSIDNSGLDAGICRLTLVNVTTESSGFVLTDVRSKYRINGKRGDYMLVTTLIVKAAPPMPELTLTTADGNDDEYAVLEASCFVGPARPVAQITWLLGDEVIRSDLTDDADSGTVWLWEYEAQTITQNLSRRLTPADNGKELVCRAEHIALPGGSVEARMTITVKEPLRRLASRLNLLSRTAWLLIGLGSCILLIVIVLAAVGITYACVIRSWRYANQELEKAESSAIYDDINLSIGCNEVTSTNDFFEMDQRMSCPSSCQDSFKSKGNNYK